MKRKRKLHTIFLVVSFLFLGSQFIVSSNASSNVNILCFVANGFGDSYHINKGIMESYGWTVTTSGITGLVLGCNNNGKDVNDTFVDVIVDTIEDEDLSDYDCVFIPSGGHWANIISITRILEIIDTAHEQGIFVAGICTGMIPLAFADVLDGVDVAFNIHAYEYLEPAGANMTCLNVVSDQGVITGGFGGGLYSGPEGAPNEAFCDQLKEDIELKLSETNFTSILTIFSSIGILSIITIRRNYPKV